MGDSCHMQVTCRRQDRNRFEKLGFHLESEETSNSPLIEMIDEGVDNAHHHDLPRDIPFTAWNGAACNYGDGKVACDGREFADVSGNNDGFVVVWDRAKNEPTQQSLDAIRHYLRVLESVTQMFKGLSARTT